MSFSDDGWGAQESEVEVAVEQLKEKQFTGETKTIVKVFEKHHPKMETIEEQAFNIPTANDIPKMSAAFTRCLSNELPAKRDAGKKTDSPVDNGSDDGWGTPVREYRAPIVTEEAASKLPPARITQQTPPVDDTLDIESPRELSPVPPFVKNMNLSETISAASSHIGSEFGRPVSIGGKSFGTQNSASFGIVEPNQTSCPTGNRKVPPILNETQRSFGQSKSDGKNDTAESGRAIGSEKQFDQKETRDFNEARLGSLKPSGFSGSFGGPKSSTTKPSGFGSMKPSGFGGTKTSDSFGDKDESLKTIDPTGHTTSQISSGFGETLSTKRSEIISYKIDAPSKTQGSGSTALSSGFGDLIEIDSKPISVGQESIKSFSGKEKSSAKSVNFGHQTFGSGGDSMRVASLPESDVDGVSRKFGSEKNSGFGGAADQSTSMSFGTGADSNKLSGFGGHGSAFGGAAAYSAKTGFGCKPERGNVDGCKPESSKLVQSQTGFGEAPTSGFGGAKTSGFGGANTSGFGGAPTFGSIGAPTSGLGGAKTSGFGGASTSGFGGAQTSGFGGASTSGFGEANISGFGEAPASGFGGAPTLGFGGGQTSGFGGASTSGFGETQSCGFGDNSNNGFGSSSVLNNPKKEKTSFGQFGKVDGGFGGEGWNTKENGWGNASGQEGAERPRGCHNCGEEGHISKECEKPKQPRYPCRNCNELGHFPKDCDKPRTPFGPCRNCQEEGHFAKDCTKERVRTEPTEPCRRCSEEGHWSSECPSRPRDLEGNILVPYDVVFTPEEEMFNNAVNNDHRINFDQKVVASMGENTIPDMASFDEFKVLPQDVHDNLKRMKMNRPTPIQRAAFYSILHGQDVVACSHTGSGKTLAFLIPLVINLLEDRANHYDVTDEKPSPRLLIVAPTRELANQTFNTARQLTYQTGLKCGLAYGGYSRSANLQHLRSFDQLGILVATMGRLQDFMESEEVNLSKIKFVVLDEADRMVATSDFGEEVTKVLGPPEQRTHQTILFSASFSESLQAEDLPKFVKEGYTMLQVDKFGTANENIDQQILPVPRNEKRTELYKLLGFEENTMSVLPDARIEKEKTLIFVNSVKFCDTLASNIASCGVPCISMHSHQNQEQRDRTLDDFRRGKYKCMVASNVCARGLNIAELDHVINYDMPDKNGFDEYVNRIGRTARAGFTGVSTAFIDEENDREIIPNLVNVLMEAKKEVPDWLVNINEGAGEENVEDTEQW